MNPSRPSYLCSAVFANERLRYLVPVNPAHAGLFYLRLNATVIGAICSDIEGQFDMVDIFRGSTPGPESRVGRSALGLFGPDLGTIWMQIGVQHLLAAANGWKPKGVSCDAQDMTAPKIEFQQGAFGKLSVEPVPRSKMLARPPRS